MAVQPLSPATDRRLGGPLPRQLSNQTRGHLPALKSLAARSCDHAALCGISSRFQLLSPSGRQVPHALLTRPPLSSSEICRSFNHKNSVRLACVRHAASVRPEPGSNSLKKFKSFGIQLITNLKISGFKFLLIAFAISSLKIWTLTINGSFFMMLFNFQSPLLSRSLRALS